MINAGGGRERVRTVAKGQNGRYGSVSGYHQCGRRARARDDRGGDERDGVGLDERERERRET